MKDKITVIIVSYNTLKILDECLKSLSQSKNIYDINIIVVDNGSTDGTVEYLYNKRQTIDAINNNINIGYGKAINQALGKVKSRYTIISNSDIIFNDETIPGMIEMLRKNNKYAMIGPKLIYKNGTRQISIRLKPSLLNSILQLIFISKIYYVYKETVLTVFHKKMVKVDCISGALFAGRTNALKAVGGFDERFKFYSEDVDLCLKIAENKWKVGYTNIANAIHAHGASSFKKVGQKSIFVCKQIVAKTMLYQKWFSMRKVRILIWLHKIDCLKIIAIKKLVTVLLSDYYSTDMNIVEYDQWCIVAEKIDNKKQI